MPATYDGRAVKDQGTIYVSDRDVMLQIWDNGSADGDMITLIVNDMVVLSNYTLEGIANKKEIDLKLDNEGYNYLLVFINDDGSLSPDETVIAIDDGTGEQQSVLTGSAAFCGALNIYVQ